jgi:lipopolysaccharide/colanic/teichoic acid biosynthesis glycosyltransferase
MKAVKVSRPDRGGESVRAATLDVISDEVVLTGTPNANPFFGLDSDADSQFGTGDDQRSVHPGLQRVDGGPAGRVERRHEPRQHAAARSDELLLEHQFLRQLQREKRRAERSRLPLSMVLFRIEGPANADRTGEYRLFETLVSSKRETDILGVLSDGTFAILLTDTGRDGATQFQRKIEQRSRGIRTGSIARTYPDQLFDELTKSVNNGTALEPLLLEGGIPRSPAGRFFKRTLDLLGASCALIMSSPVMLVAALAVRGTSSGPIIFKQVRLGRGGKPFVFYKFRSMYADSDDRIHREYVTGIIKRGKLAQGAGSQAWSKLERDPRITPVGRFIRKTSIDELPQLFNVLQGHLSLVGPRPPLPYEAAEYEAWHLRRILEVKPGITGLWQVAGRGATTFDDMVRLDLEYIRLWSPWLDLRILLRTIGVVVRRHGAE